SVHFRRFLGFEDAFNYNKKSTLNQLLPGCFCYDHVESTTSGKYGEYIYDEHGLQSEAFVESLYMLFRCIHRLMPGDADYNYAFASKGAHYICCRIQSVKASS
ncbi:hypothetical protein Tco_1276145, partial [Tanacetum coccineum]